MTRVLIVSQHFGRGGLETQVEGFCQFLSSLGDHLHIATSGESNLDSLAPFLSGSCRVDRWGPEGESILAASSTLQSYITEHEIEWVHLHPFESFFAGGLAAARLQVPFCVTLHSPESLTWFPGISYRAFLASCLLPDATRVFAVSRETAHFSNSLAKGIKPVLLPNGVDLQQYPKAEREPDGSWAIVGRLDSDKMPGIQEALSFFSKARKRRLVGNVTVFGDGASRSTIEDWARSNLETDGWLTFRGYAQLWSEELQDGKWAGVAGMGRVVLEGASMGLPVFLIGYDGVKGLVTEDNIDRLSLCNFSGRRERNLDYPSFERALAGLNAEANGFQVRNWVDRNADAAKIWAHYRREMLAGLHKRKPLPEWGDAFEDCCRRLGSESIYSSTGVAQIMDCVVPSTGRSFNAGQELLVELLRVVEERKHLAAELAMYRLKADHEKALGAEKVSAVEKQLALLGQERDAAFEKVDRLNEKWAEEKKVFEGQVQELYSRFQSLEVGRDRTVQAEALSRQLLEEERARSGERVLSLEREQVRTQERLSNLVQELETVRQERERLRQKSSESEQGFLTVKEGLEKRLRELEISVKIMESEKERAIASERIAHQVLAEERAASSDRSLHFERERARLQERNSGLQRESNGLRQELEASQKREGEREEAFQKKKDDFERQLREVEIARHVLGGERDQAIESERVARQMLAEERTRSGERILDLEQKMEILRKTEAAARQREQERTQGLQVEMERAAESETRVQQRLMEERAHWGKEISRLEESLISLGQERLSAWDERDRAIQAMRTNRDVLDREREEMELFVSQLKMEKDLLLESHTAQQLAAEEKLAEQEREIVTLGNEKERLHIELAGIRNLLDEQEGLIRRYEREQEVQKDQRTAVEADRTYWWKTYDRDKRLWQQENAGLKEELRELKQGREQSVQSGTVRRQEPEGPFEDLFEQNFSLQERFWSFRRERERTGSQLAKLWSVLESLRRTSSWRFMCFLRRLREQAIHGRTKDRWEFCRWVCRRMLARKEPDGNPTFDPIGKLNGYNLTRLQAAIKNAQEIRSWRIMCFLYTVQKQLIRKDLSRIWELRKLLFAVLFKKEPSEPWTWQDPIPLDLMQPPLRGRIQDPDAVEAGEMESTTFVFALDRGWGDVLMSLPVAETLKKRDPYARIIYILGREDHLPILENNPYVDEVLFSRSQLLSFPDARTFDIRSTPSDWHRSRLHMTDLMANRFGVEVHDRRPSLYVPDDMTSLKKFRVTAPYAVAHVQSTTREKDWDLKNWGPVFNHLYEEHGLEIILVGGPNEQALPGEASRFVHDLRGRTSLRETINLIKNARLFVGIDSGPMHIAGALNIPCVVLWGNTSPVICGIQSDVVYNIEPERQCERGAYWPCHAFPCPEEECCINRIPIRQVVQCVNGCLAKDSGVLMVNIGRESLKKGKNLSGKHHFVHQEVFDPGHLNGVIVSSPSEYVVLSSSETSAERLDEWEGMAAIAKERQWGICSTTCFRYVGAGRYEEYRDNSMTQAHRGAPDFVIFRKAVFTRLGGFDPRAESLSCCLNDFYFKGLLMGETVWSMKGSSASAAPGEETGRDDGYSKKKWGEVDLAGFKHLEAVSFLNNKGRDETLYLIFSHCALNFGGGGQRWDSLAQVGWRHGYRILYISEIMPDEEAEAVVHEFSDTPAPRKIVVWARPVPRYKKHFDYFNQKGIPQIYDCIDDWKEIMVGEEAVASFEGELIRKTKMVTATAATLRDKIKAIRSSQEMVPLIPNGADPEIFDYRRRYDPPPDLRKGAITLGYFGSLAEWWIDDELICHLATRLKDGVINLIGPCNDKYRETFSKYPNIAVLGQKPHGQLPSYLSHFDVALIPFKVIPVVESTNPVKVYEYLFGGKPVVSSDLPEVRGLPHVFCSATHDAFSGNVSKACKEKMESRGLDGFRALHSWESRFRECLVQIDLANPRVDSVDIIIVNYNTKTLTENCIRSIERNTKHYQLFVADNHSTDGSVEMLEEMARDGRLKLIEYEQNMGYGKAVNGAVKRGSSSFIAILNSDIEVVSHWMEPLIEALKADEKTAVVSPKLISPSGGVDCAGVWGRNAEPLIRTTESNHFGVFNRVLESVYVSGACMVTRRTTFEELGGFDERFFFYFEDTDLCFNARYRGYRTLYIPNSVVVHHRSKASQSNSGGTGTWYSQSEHLFREKWKDKLTDEAAFPLE